MLFSKLPKQKMELLSEVIKKHRPDLIYLLDLPCNTLLTAEQREWLRETIADEFVENGLYENDEPNPLGEALEDLIERLWYFSEQD